ncbi:MAG: DUF4157 domain-containing protein [Ignavibacteriae bacterium]|nr:MAG: DUF4157 domain-containing protein [Ignavibacteriota bacterium]
MQVATKILVPVDPKKCCLKCSKNNRSIDNTSFFQPKLKVSQPNDIYEQEADAMADKVMRMTDKDVNRNTFFKPANSSIQRKCNLCKEEKEKLQRKEAGSIEASTAPQIVHDVLNSSSGKSLDSSTRSFFEPRFGYDFSNVRVHTGSEAEKSAQSINALAYTSGNNIVFGEKQYAPETNTGKKLIGHELTHVVQQTNKPLEYLQRQLITPLGQGGGYGGLLNRDYRRSLSNPTVPTQPLHTKLYSFNVTYNECEKNPYVKDNVISAVKLAFNKVFYSNCIRSDSLKDEVLNEFDGLNIDCEQSGDDCGMASRYLTQTVNIYPNALNNNLCGPLASTILHEIVHLTEWRLFGHGNLADACEKSCFGYGSGDASKCK